MGKRGITYPYKGVEYDSPEEIAFVWWLEELKEAGFVKEWIREPVKIKVTETLKNAYVAGRKKGEQTILQDYEYVPDFVIEWNKTAKDLFFNVLGENKKITLWFIGQYIGKGIYSYVEIKPIFDFNSMTRLFRHTQKVLWQYKKDFVNLIKIEKLFAETFTPTPYLTTKTGKKKKINWPVRSLEEFLNERNVSN